MAGKILHLEGVDRGADQYKVDPLLIQIRPGHNPRTVFDPGAMAELEASILENGLREAITISLDGETVYLVDGERRLRAITNLIGQGHRDSFQRIPAIQQHPTRCAPVDLLLTALIKNQSEPLEPLDFARACNRLHLDFHMSIDTIAMKLGKSPGSIRDFLRLLDAGPDLQAMLEDGEAKFTEVVQTVRHADKANIPQADALQVVRDMRAAERDAKREAREQTATRGTPGGRQQTHSQTPRLVLNASMAMPDDQETALRAILQTMDRTTALAIIFDVIPKRVVEHFFETGEVLGL